PYPASSVVFSGDGKMLAAAWITGKKKGEVEVWNVSTLQLMATLTPMIDQDELGLGVIFSPDSRLLVAFGHQEVPIWDLSTSPPQRVLDHICLPLFSRDGGLMLNLDSAHSRVETWDTGTIKRCATLHWETGDSSLDVDFGDVSPD